MRFAAFFAATCCAVVLALTPSICAQSTKYSAKGAGEVKIQYGTPQYSEKTMEGVRPGLTWRLGAGGPTVMESQAAIVLGNEIVFPGKYTLTANCRSKENWDLVVTEGVQRRQRGGGGNSGGDGKNTAKFNFPLKRSLVEKKRLHTDRLSIDLTRSKDKAVAKAGGADFKVRFGPHVLATVFHCYGVSKKSKKLGKTGYVLETVKLPLTEERQKMFDADGEEFTFARITLKRGEDRSLVILRTGEEPTLELREFSRNIKGTRKQSQSKKTKLTVKATAKEMSLHIGTTSYHFPLEKNSFSKAELGGSTPSNGGR